MTAAFHQRNFNDRLNTMGDPAEQACDAVYEGKTHELGLNRVWKNGVGLYMANMTPAMRYTPDRMIIDRFIECMGIGRDKTLKIKTEKISALLEWDGSIGPTDLFVFDQVKDHYYQANIKDWVRACTKHGETKTFPEGKHYVALHRDGFPISLGEVPRVETATPI